ncbi:hypothetical protein GCM10010522_56240 [Kribbella solani]|nr:ATP-binding protein [Kribbella solani]
MFYRGPADNGTGAWWLAEFVVSLGVVGVLARRGALAGGVALVVAIGASPLRLTLHLVPAVSARGVVIGCALCGGLAIVAAGIGWYLRSIEVRRTRAVLAARETQRLELARDLHDFVAHDVSGMVVQAQAALLVTDPVVTQDALRRIEAAGLRAMESMDRTVQLLHAAEAPYGFADLRALTERFTAPRATLELAVDSAPGPIEATVYRVVAEALTNVRRHAPGASTVEVVVTQTSTGLRLTVTDDGPAARKPKRDGHSGLGPSGRRRGSTGLSGPRGQRGGLSGPRGRRGGLGLVGLGERVDALGGELTAGPVDGRGWRVVAVFP